MKPIMKSFREHIKDDIKDVLDGLYLGGADKDSIAKGVIGYLSNLGYKPKNTEDVLMTREEYEKYKQNH